MKADATYFANYLRIMADAIEHSEPNYAYQMRQEANRMEGKK